MPALGADQRGEHVQPDARHDPGDRVAARGDVRRLLLTRPPDDRRECDERYQGLDERETAVHGEDGGAWTGRTVAIAITRKTASTNAATLRRLARRALPILVAFVALCPRLGARLRRAAPPVTPPAELPGGKPLIREGQTNRQLLGGTW